MTVNPNVDGYTKTLNDREIHRKTQKYSNLLKTKRMLKSKYRLNKARLFHLAYQEGGRFAPLPPR